MNLIDETKRIQQIAEAFVRTAADEFANRVGQQGAFTLRWDLERPRLVVTLTLTMPDDQLYQTSHFIRLGPNAEAEAEREAVLAGFRASEHARKYLAAQAKP